MRNAPDVLGWNPAKTYLRELAAAGVPVVPTTFLGPHEPYQDSVNIRGETALVFIDGRFSHAANKAALLAVGRPPTEKKLFAAETMAAAVPTTVEREIDVRAVQDQDDAY